MTEQTRLAALLPIEQCSLGIERHTVRATAVHRALRIGRDFSNWIKGQITRADLVEGTDYEVLTENWENFREQSGASTLIRQKGRIKQDRGGDRRSIDYLLTLEAAKNIALMSNTPMGKEVRRYFIAAERALHRLSVGGSLLAVEELGRLERDRELLEAAGSRAGRVLGSLRSVRLHSDTALESQRRAIQPDLLELLELGHEGREGAAP